MKAEKSSLVLLFLFYFAFSQLLCFFFTFPVHFEFKKYELCVFMTVGIYILYI